MRPIATKSLKVIQYFKDHPTAEVKKVAAKFKMALPKIYTLRKRAREESWQPPELLPVPEIPKPIAGGRRVTLNRAQLAIAKKLKVPLDKFVDEEKNYTEYYVTDSVSYEDESSLAMDNFIRVNEGDDVGELFGVQKWEAPIAAQLRGVVRGNFPSFLRKTDQERVQNLDRELEIGRAHV